MYEFTQRLNNISVFEIIYDNFNQLKKIYINKTIQCNGWGYLVLDGNHLDIITLPDHQNICGSVELLVINLWDYAYKYDYGDDRRQYLK